MRFIRVVTCVSTSFLLPNNIPLDGYATFCLSIHQLMDIWVYFHFFTIMNNVAMNIHVQLFVWTCVFSSLGLTPSSRIAGSHGNSSFNILSNCQTVFQSDHAIL